MPTYEYRCKKGHEFEVVQGFTDDPVTKCPTCGSAVERVYSAPAIVFKGKGFHNTDYGTRKRPVGDTGSSDSGSSSSSESASSSDTSSSTDSGSSSSSSSTESKTEKKDSKPADKPAAKKDSK